MADYRIIVVGTDGSETSLRAVEKAATIAAENGAKLIVASALGKADANHAGPDPDQARNDDYRTVGNAPQYELLHDAAALAQKAGATDVEERALQGAAADALIELADETGADLLVVGSVGMNSIAGRLMGSVPRLVRRGARTEVLVVDTTN